MTEKQATQTKPTRRPGAIFVVILVALLAVVLAVLWAVLAGQRTPRRGPAQPSAAMVNTWRWVFWILGSLAVIVILRITARSLAHGVTSAWDAVYSRWVTWRQDVAMLKAAEQQTKLNAVRQFEPNEHGRLGVTMDAQGNYRDLDTLRAFNQMQTVYLDPILEQVGAIRNLLEAGGGWPTPATAQAVLPSAAAQQATLQPSTLNALISKYSFKPQLTRILIGEYVDAETNSIKPLTLSIPQAVHVLCTGASGLGKSTLLEAVALQLAGLPDIRLAAIDYGSGTFDALETALHWQIADSPDLALALLRELIRLCQERRELYKAVGRVRSLDQYNAASGQNLPFVVAFADETSALLEHAGTKAPFVELARMGRKYGVGLILGGTDFKASTLPSEARSNCQARLAFWLERGLSQSLLDCNDASKLGGIGEIVVKRPGVVGTVRGRTPEVTEAAYKVLALRRDRALTLDAVHVHSSPSGNGRKPDLDQVDDPTLPDADRVHLLHNAGASDSAIAGRLWHNNTFYLDKVRKILADPVVVVANGDGDPGDQVDGAQVHNNNNNTGSVDFCDFCARSVDDAPKGVTFATCAGCGVAVCSDCATGGLCPVCQNGEG